MFSEENKTVAVKHEIQLLFRIHILYRDNGVTAILLEPKQPKGSVMLTTRKRILATV
jgi:hypothetical protein